MKTRNKTHRKVLQVALAAFVIVAMTLIQNTPAKADGFEPGGGRSLIDYKPPKPSLNILDVPASVPVKKKVFLGTLNSNRFDPDSVSNPYGRYGSPYSSKSINNPYGKYGSRFSPQGASNPYTTGGPRIYGEE